MPCGRKMDRAPTPMVASGPGTNLGLDLLWRSVRETSDEPVVRRDDARIDAGQVIPELPERRGPGRGDQLCVCNGYAIDRKRNPFRCRRVLGGQVNRQCERLGNVPGPLTDVEGSDGVTRTAYGKDEAILAADAHIRQPGNLVVAVLGIADHEGRFLHAWFVLERGPGHVVGTDRFVLNGIVSRAQQAEYRAVGAGALPLAEDDDATGETAECVLDGDKARRRRRNGPRVTEIGGVHAVVEILRIVEVVRENIVQDTTDEAERANRPTLADIIGKEWLWSQVVVCRRQHTA